MSVASACPEAPGDVPARSVLVAANGALGATLLDVIERAGVTPVGVLVGPARPGRPEPCPFVSQWARRRRIPSVHVASWRDDDPATALGGLRFDVLLSVAYDLILPEAALALARCDAVNLHRGLAPDFRGCYSTTWALESAAPAVGVTLHRMEGEVDAGPILAQRSLTVGPEQTAAELTPLVEDLAASLLGDTIGPLLAGALTATPQSGGTSFPHRLPSHELDPEATARVADRVRALHSPPHPPVTLTLGARRFAIVEADPEPVTTTLAGGAHQLAFSAPAAAFAHALALGDGPVVLPDCGPGALYSAAAACGRPLRHYRLAEDLAPEPASLWAALEPGALAVLPAAFGRPVAAEAARLVARAGAGLLEDRGDAALSHPGPVAHLAVVGLHPWLPVPDGALLLSAQPLPEPEWAAPDFALIGARLEAAARAAEGGEIAAGPESLDLTPRAMSRFTQRALGAGPARAEAAADADRLAAALMPELGDRCPFTHWPSGHHPHGFPLIVADAADAQARLAAAGIAARRPWIAGSAGGAALAAQLLLITGGDVTAAAAALIPVATGVAA